MPVECVTFGLMDPWWMPQDLPICQEQLILNTTADLTRKSTKAVFLNLLCFKSQLKTIADLLNQKMFKFCPRKSMFYSKHLLNEGIV